MTLILGLGMATASFAGNVEATNTAEAEKAEAPKVCAEVHSPECGPMLVCANTSAELFAEALHVFNTPHIYC